MRKAFFVLVVLSACCFQVLNAQANYDFVLKFSSYKLQKNNGDWNIPVDQPSTFSFSKDGKACLEFGDRKYEFNFDTFKPLQYNWEESPNGFKIIIDDENYILFSTTSDFALINIPRICPYMNFVKWENKDILGDVLNLYNKLQKG